jgi:hypothetical protein
MMVVTSAKTLFSSAAPPGGSTRSKSPQNSLSFSIALCLPPNLMFALHRLLLSDELVLP